MALRPETQSWGSPASTSPSRILGAQGRDGGSRERVREPKRPSDKHPPASLMLLRGPRSLAAPEVQGGGRVLISFSLDPVPGESKLGGGGGRALLPLEDELTRASGQEGPGLPGDNCRRVRSVPRVALLLPQDSTAGRGLRVRRVSAEQAAGEGVPPSVPAEPSPPCRGPARAQGSSAPWAGCLRLANTAHRQDDTNIY